MYKTDKNRSVLLVTVILFLLLVVFFHKVIFQGYSLWPADYIFSLSPWNSVAPEGYTGPYNYMLFDNIFVYYPWFHIVSDALKNGSIPLWNPYCACGLPLFANSTGFLFPLNIIFYIMPLWYAFGVVAFMKLFFAGLFTYLYLRSVSVNSFGSVVGAISFMFSGFMIGWLGHPHTNIALCLPLLFLLTEKIVVEKGDLRFVSLMSLGVAVSFLGGHYETTFHVLAATGIYFLFRILTLYRDEKDIRSTLRLTAFFSVSIVVGVAIASIQLIPAWEYITRSSRLGEITGGGNYISFKAFSRFFTSLKASILYLVPDFYGNPVDHNGWGEAVGIWNYIEQSGYAGVLPVFLSFFAVFIGFKNKFVIFFTVLGLLSLGIVYHLPVLADIVYNLPVFASLNNNRIILVYCFSIAVLAGFGISFLTESQFPEKDRKDGHKKKVYILLSVLFLFSILLAAGLRYITAYGKISTVIADYNAGDYISRSIWLFLLWAVGGILLLFIYVRRYINIVAFKVLIMVLLAADLLSFGMKFWPAIEPEKIFPSTPAIEFLKSDKGVFRIFGVGNILSTNTGVPYGLYDIRGYDGITIKDYERFITGRTGDNSFYMAGRYIPRHIDLMNVKYLLFPRNTELHNSWFTKVYTGEIDIYMNLNCLPRAFVVHKATVVKDDEDALARVYRPEFDPSADVIIDSDLPPAFKRLTEATSVEYGSTANINNYTDNKVAIDVEMQTPGFLVLSDTYYPGWKVFIDGVESHIYRADYIFRAVFVDKGKHNVEFRYDPFSFKIGCIISLVFFLLTAGIFINSLFRKNK